VSNMSSRRPLSVRARPFALVAALWNLILLMKLVAELQLDELLERVTTSKGARRVGHPPTT
jgi:hypothetical protein